MLLGRQNFLFYRRRKGGEIPPTPSRPEGLIGQYKPYLNSNDSPTRDILKDYSGQGHDIQLYNFLYALGSGYGSWAQDFKNTKWHAAKDRATIDVYSTKFIVSSIKSKSACFYYQSTGSEQSFTVPSIKFRVTGLTDGQTLLFDITGTDTGTVQLKFDTDGIHTIDSFEFKGLGNYYGFQFSKLQETCNITIEQIPDYPGALVSDGVDDYGLCEKAFGEVGTVIVMLDEIDWKEGKFLYDTKDSGNNRIFCWKNASGVSSGNPNVASTLQNKFNVFTRNPLSVSTNFSLFTKDGPQYNASVALYGMELYSKKLTDEEIESVKESMYNEYLTATNALQKSYIADYECYDKTNEDEDRDVLKDLSGNGHDITLYNFGFAEGSGYGLYKENWKSSGANGGSYGVTHVKTYNSISVSVPASISNNFYLSKIREVGERINFKILVSGIPEGVTLEASLLGSPSRNFNLINGVNVIDITKLETDGNRLYFTYRGLIDTPYTITVKEIPEYQGALVSDGVDDYGLCENFPILNKEDGYTILTIRKHITFPFAANTGFISKRDMRISIDIGTVFEKWGNTSTPESTCSFGLGTAVDIDNEKLFSYQTSNIYNGQSILVGSQEDNPCLILFGSTINESGKVVGFSNSALYAFKILNKDCTTEEIKFIAKQMVAKHKEKTGETIELNF